LRQKQKPPRAHAHAGAVGRGGRNRKSPPRSAYRAFAPGLARKNDKAPLAVITSEAVTVRGGRSFGARLERAGCSVAETAIITPRGVRWRVVGTRGGNVLTAS
jgi:hypothetical protein